MSRLFSWFRCSWHDHFGCTFSTWLMLPAGPRYWQCERHPRVVHLGKDRPLHEYTDNELKALGFDA